MPQYVCSTPKCISKGKPFMLTSAGQTFCPKCQKNSLQPFVAPVQRVERMVVVNDGSTMTLANGKSHTECIELIDKFTLTVQSEDEAGITSDYIVKLGADKRKRIDRQGPVKTGNTITHARFAVQLGNPIYAGIHMPIDTNFSIRHVRAAFKQSLLSQKYVRIYIEEV
jgi:hypothetical protein